MRREETMPMGMARWGFFTSSPRRYLSDLCAKTAMSSLASYDMEQYSKFRIISNERLTDKRQAWKVVTQIGSTIQNVHTANADRNVPSSTSEKNCHTHCWHQITFCFAKKLELKHLNHVLVKCLRESMYPEGLFYKGRQIKNLSNQIVMLHLFQILDNDNWSVNPALWDCYSTQQKKNLNKFTF